MKAGSILAVLVAVLVWCGAGYGETDLAVLPGRASVQLTIYNSADLTLVREKRVLTLRKGINRLRFSWNGTRIDPTSLDLRPGDRADETGVVSLSFPPGVRHLGIWKVRSRSGGRIPIEISYLTSGLSWQARYVGILDPSEKTMTLRGILRVANHSGEDYENARIRVIVGRIHLIDRIADLARRGSPYGRPIEPGRKSAPADNLVRAEAMKGVKRRLMKVETAMAKRPREIRKEGMSEYFLYAIEGETTIPAGESMRLPALQAEKVAVVNLYRYDEDRYGGRVVRFLSFRNDKAHGLGKTPIPGGNLVVYRDTGRSHHLAFEGRSRFKYVPVDKKAALTLGKVNDVIVRPELMNYRTKGYLFDRRGDISGWDEIREFRIRVKNTRGVSVRVEVRRSFGSSSWDLRRTGGGVAYEKIDVDTVKFSLDLPPHARKTFGYILTLHHGKRSE